MKFCFGKLIFCVAVAGYLLSHSISAYGKVYIDINSPAFQKFPIAITDFQKMDGHAGDEKLATWFSDDLSRLLNLTGFFRIISKKAFLESPSQNAQLPERINFPDWSVIGAEYLVKGGFKYNQKDLVAEFRLYDVVKGELIVGKRYTGFYEDRKEMSTRFADEVIYALTGERGIFDSKIAFITKKGAAADIYVTNFEGTVISKITDHKAFMMAPRWSPDGRYLSFTSYKSGNPDLYVKDLIRNRLHRVAHFKGINLSGHWSPDGKKLLLTLSKDGNEEIYVMELATGKLQRLTDNYAIDVSPTWSPDGKRIAFVSNRSGSPQIYIMNADGSNVTRISFEGNYNTSPAWSPKENRIAYESRKNGHFQIHTMKEDGNDPVQVTFEAGDCETPSWSPDGRYLVFSMNAVDRQMICVINANGTNRRVLQGGADGYLGPSWSGRKP